MLPCTQPLLARQHLKSRHAHKTQARTATRLLACVVIMRPSLETRIKFCITFVVCLCLRFSRNRRAVEISNIIEIPVRVLSVFLVAFMFVYYMKKYQEHFEYRPF